MSSDAPRPALCPSCRQLVGVNDEACFNCGRKNPGRPGVASLVTRMGEAGFATGVVWACGALYVCTLVAHVNGIGMDGLFGFLSPSGVSMFLFGASGASPVFGYGRWWTVLSAGWLHGSFIHILFNMMWVRDLLPPLTRVYGTGRIIIIYSVSSATGFTASTLAGLLPFPWPLGGGSMTLGASASVFGLFGAAWLFGHRASSTVAREYAKMWIVGGVVFGFLLPGIDNWAHLGGLAGGYLTARVLDPLKPEQEWHSRLAAACLALSAIAVLVSVATGLRYFK